MASTFLAPPDDWSATEDPFWTKNFWKNLVEFFRKSNQADFDQAKQNLNELDQQTQEISETKKLQLYLQHYKIIDKILQLAEVAISLKSVKKISRGMQRERSAWEWDVICLLCQQPREVVEPSVKINSLFTIGHNGTPKGCVATLVLELLADGQIGKEKMYPSPEINPFLLIHESFRLALKNAVHAAIADLRSNEKNRLKSLEGKDIRWSLQRRDGEPFPSEVKDDSMGLVFALAFWKLVSNDPELELDDVVATAAIDRAADFQDERAGKIILPCDALIELDYAMPHPAPGKLYSVGNSIIPKKAACDEQRDLRLLVISLEQSNVSQEWLLDD